MNTLWAGSAKHQDKSVEEPSEGSEAVRGLPTIPPTIITIGDIEKKFILPLYTSLILSTGDKSRRRGREAWM